MFPFKDSFELTFTPVTLDKSVGAALTTPLNNGIQWIYRSTLIQRSLPLVALEGDQQKEGNDVSGVTYTTFNRALSV